MGFRRTPWDWQGEVINCGIQDVGNGWYRCWLEHGKYTGSVHAKASDQYPRMAMDMDESRVWFDLETGEVSAGRNLVPVWDTIPDFAIVFENDLYIWGPQLERRTI